MNTLNVFNIRRRIRRRRRATNKPVLKNVYLNYYILERPVIRSVREAKFMEITGPLGPSWSVGSGYPLTNKSDNIVVIQCQWPATYRHKRLVVDKVS